MEIQIRGRKHPWGRYLLIIWLVFWTFYGFQWSQGSVWLLFWVLAEIMGVYALLWSEFGREIIAVREGHLIVKHALFGWGPVRRFEAAKVREVRAAGYFEPDPSQPPSPLRGILYLLSFGFLLLPDWSLKQGTVTFRYGPNTYRIGARLTKAEAEELAGRLKPLLRQTRRAKQAGVAPPQGRGGSDME